MSAPPPPDQPARYVVTLIVTIEDPSAADALNYAMTIQPTSSDATRPIHECYVESVEREEEP